MQALAKTNADDAWLRYGNPRPAWSHLASWRSLVAVIGCLGVAAAGLAANGALDFPALRAQVAVAVGSLASSIVIIERWSADPEAFVKGGSLALSAGLAAAIACLG